MRGASCPTVSTPATFPTDASTQGRVRRALPLPPAMSHSRCPAGKAASATTAASTLVAFESFTHSTPSRVADGLEPVRQPGKAVQPRLEAVSAGRPRGRRAASPPSRSGGCARPAAPGSPTRKPELLREARAGSRPPPARPSPRSPAGGDSPGRRVKPEAASARGVASIRDRPAVVRVHHRHVARLLVLEECAPSPRRRPRARRSGRGGPA